MWLNVLQTPSGYWTLPQNRILTPVQVILVIFLSRWITFSFQALWRVTEIEILTICSPLMLYGVRHRCQHWFVRRLAIPKMTCHLNDMEHFQREKLCLKFKTFNPRIFFFENVSKNGDRFNVLNDPKYVNLSKRTTFSNRFCVYVFCKCRKIRFGRKHCFANVLLW